MGQFTYTGEPTVTKSCRACVWNKRKECGKDFCLFGKCIYPAAAENTPVKKKA